MVTAMSDDPANPNLFYVVAYSAIPVLSCQTPPALQAVTKGQMGLDRRTTL